MNSNSRLRWLIFIVIALILVLGSMAIINLFYLLKGPLECEVRLEPSTVFTASNLNNSYELYGYVAHALGSVDGETYTNSLEAFELSYKKGFKIFEVDMVLLKDGTVFCAHDGYEERYGLDKRFRQTSYKELAGKLYLGKYTPLNGSQLLDLLDKYKDIHIIADTKYEHIKIIEALVAEAEQKYPSVLDRLIPHISGPCELCRMNQIHQFKDYILALYRSREWDPGRAWCLFCSPTSNEQIAKFVKKCGISAVMMQHDQRYTPEFQELLSSVGAVTYVHSLSSPEAIDYFKEREVGVYSDGFSPN